MSDYVKGPWKRGGKQTMLFGAPAYIVCDSTKQIVAAINPFIESHGDNADKKLGNLVAAAPSLLEAVNDFLHGYCDEPSELFHERMSDLAYKMRMASRKAEGKL